MFFLDDRINRKLIIKINNYRGVVTGISATTASLDVAFAAKAEKRNNKGSIILILADGGSVSNYVCSRHSITQK